MKTQKINKLVLFFMVLATSLIFGQRTEKATPIPARKVMTEQKIASERVKQMAASGIIGTSSDDQVKKCECCGRMINPNLYTLHKQICCAQIPNGGILNKYIVPTDCTKFYIAESFKSPCSADRGVCCWAAPLEKNFDLIGFDKLIELGDSDKIREYFKGDLKAKGMSVFVSTETGKNIVSGILNGEITFEKVSPKVGNEYMIKLIKVIENYKNVSYVGHVTIIK